MFTLDRLSLMTAGLGVGLVLAGCASPVEGSVEAAQSADEVAVGQTTAAIEAQDKATSEDMATANLSEDATDPPVDENVDSQSEAIFGFGPGFGFGRFGGWGFPGFGFGGWGSPGWGAGWGTGWGTGLWW